MTKPDTLKTIPRLCCPEPRHAVATCCQHGKASAEELANLRLALGLTLGSVARMTVVPQAGRSKYRFVQYREHPMPTEQADQTAQG